MKKVKKQAFFITLIFILVFAFLSIFGVHTKYGDVTRVWIKGIDDIRWGIDIRGGVDVTFTPPEGVTANEDEMNAARAIIETRMIAKAITDYEVYVDYNTQRIIARFPWQSDDEDFDPEQAVKELGEMAMLTFREGTIQYEGETHESLPLVLSGLDVKKATPYYNPDNGEYEVSLELNDSGTASFSDATGRLAGNGVISIWLDDFMFSAPSVNTQISNGKATISGSFDRDTVQDLADKINGGALPFKLETDSFSTISPTVGEGAKDAMMLAMFISFCAVALFMLILYRLPGMIAVIGLIGQAVGMIALISGFFGYADSFTLTIPGIAGIILSIGMGVDANVITAERIKEELHAGKTLDGALRAGYDRAFTAIFDGNVTLIIIAFVLMGAFGTPGSFANVVLQPLFFMFGPSPAGAIYSFGYTLVIGAILNFVFGVFAARIMTLSISRFKRMRKLSFYGYKGVQ